MKSFKSIDKNLCMTYCTATVGCQVAVYDAQGVCTFFNSLFEISDSNLVDSLGVIIFYVAQSDQTYPIFNCLSKTTFNGYSTCTGSLCSIQSIVVTKNNFIATATSGGWLKIWNPYDLSLKAQFNFQATYSYMKLLKSLKNGDLAYILPSHLYVVNTIDWSIKISFQTMADESSV